jgi:hypothetical protein
MGNPRHAAIAHDAIVEHASIEEGLDRLRRADFGGALTTAAEGSLEWLTHNAVNPARRKLGHAPISDTALSDPLRQVDHFEHGVQAGVVGDVGGDIVAGGLGYLEDIGRRRLVQPVVNLAREAAGQRPITLRAEGDPVQQALLATRRGLNDRAHEIAPWDDKVTHLGRQVGTTGAVVVISIAQPELGVGLAALQGAQQAGDHARSLKGKDGRSVYESGDADLGILLNGGAQGALALVGGKWAPKLSLSPALAARAMGPLAPLLRQVAGTGVARAAGRLAGAGAEGVAENVAGVFAQNAAQRTFDPNQKLDEGLKAAVRDAVLFSVGGHVAPKVLAAAHRLRSADKAIGEARAQAKAVDHLDQAVTASPARQRDPAAVEALLDAQAGHAVVFVPAKALVDAAKKLERQGDGGAAIKAAGLEPHLEQLAAARASPDLAIAHVAASGDVAIPVGQYLVRIAPGPLGAELKPHLRFDPAGLNTVEAGRLEAALDGLQGPEREAADQLLATPPSEQQQRYGDAHDQALLDGAGPDQAHEAGLQAAETGEGGDGAPAPAGEPPPAPPSDLDAATPAEPVAPGADDPGAAEPAEATPKTPLDGAELTVDAPGERVETAQLGDNQGWWKYGADGLLMKAKGIFRNARPKTGKRTSAENYATRKAGKLGQLFDQGGHWLGRQFLGKASTAHLFPQNGNFNMGAFKAIENRMAGFADAGHEVRFEVTPSDYVGKRPGKVAVKFSVHDADGKVRHIEEHVFDNQAGQTYVKEEFGNAESH